MILDMNPSLFGKWQYFVCLCSYAYWKYSYILRFNLCVKDSVVRISTVYRMIFNHLEYFCLGRRKFSVAHYFVCSLEQSHTSHGSRGTLMTPLTDDRAWPQLGEFWGREVETFNTVQVHTTPAPDEQRGNAQHTARPPKEGRAQDSAPEKRGQQGSGRRPRGKLRPLMLAGQRPQRPI